MIKNKKPAANKKLGTTPISLNQQCTINKITSLLDFILKEVNQYISSIEREKHIRLIFPQYAYLNHLINPKKFLHIAFTFSVAHSSFLSDDQPKAIPIDSLCQPSLSKQQPKSIKSVLSQSKGITMSRNTSQCLTSSQLNKQRSVQLKLQTIEENKYVRGLRQKMLELEYEEAVRCIEKKRKGKEWKIESLISHPKSATITVDRLSVEMKRSKIIQFRNYLNSSQKNLKRFTNSEKFYCNHLECKLSKKVTKREKSQKIQPRQFTQLMESQSLVDSINVNRGIRYSHNALVFQEKKRTMSISDLKSSLGKRRISKSEFKTVKAETQIKIPNKFKLKKKKTEFERSNLTSFKRAYSEINCQRLQNGTINVMNPELRSSMLFRLEDYQSFLVIEKQFPDEDQDFLIKYRPNDLSVISYEQQDPLVQMIEPVTLTPKLPPIHNKQTPMPSTEQQQILTRLNQQMRVKLQF